MRAKLIATVFVATSVCSPSHGSMIPIGQFTGAASEGFEGLSSSARELSIFDGAATVGGSRGLNIVASRWTFKGITDPVSGSKFLGATSGPLVYRFAEPMRSFGGYFSTNAGIAGGTIRFYDALDQLIEETSLDVPAVSGVGFGSRTPTEWAWNGFTGDTPFVRVEIEGGFSTGGFVMQDDMQVSPSKVPEPASFALAGLVIGAWVRRQRG